MSTKTKISQDYHVQGNPIIKVPFIGNLSPDLAETVITQFNEVFRGDSRIEYTLEYKPGEPIRFSNIPRALGMHQIALRETNGQIGVLDPIEVVKYGGAIPDKAGTYADTSAVSVFPNPGPNENLRIRVLDILGRDPTKLEVPLLVQ
ncbi:MAG: hypothetical protein ABIB47_02860, partial [Candidatus Woesearchaeota archaeon]